MRLMFTTDLGLLYDTPQQTRALTVVDEYLYLTELYGLRVIDISTPTMPTEVGFFAALGEVNGIAIVGQYAYITGPVGGLQIVDISDPTTLTEIGSYIGSGFARDVVIRGDYAYVAADFAGIWVLDVSNPANPTELITYPTSGFAWEITVADNYIYIANRYGPLVVMDISDPRMPTEVGRTEDSYDAWDVVTVNNYVYIADGIVGLRIIDISEITAPIEVETYQPPVPYPTSLQMVDNYAYITDMYNGLRILDLSNLSTPIEIGFYDTPGSARDIAIVEDIAYIADSWEGVRIVDISNPTAPLEIGSFKADSTEYATKITVVGNYAYIISDRFLRILDVSNPSNPSQVSIYAPLGVTLDIVVKDNYAYVLSGYCTNIYYFCNRGLRVLDLSIPAKPTEVDSLQFSDWPYSIALFGNYAYIATSYSGLRIIDISVPNSPVEVAVIEGNVSDVAVMGEYAYIIDDSVGMQILDLSNPTEPSLSGIFALDIASFGFEIQEVNDKIYLLYSYHESHNFGYRNAILALQFTGHSIMGQVVQPNGLPFREVTIANSSGLSTLTDESGNYTFTSLDRGTYILTPTLSSYIFSPPNRTVSLPPIAEPQNFTILPEPTEMILTPGISTTITYTDTQGLPTHLSFPSDTISKTTTMVLTPTLVSDYGEFLFAAHAFELYAYQNGIPQADLTLGASITITFHYSEADIPTTTTDESELILYWWNGKTWIDAATTCTEPSTYNRDITNNILTLSVCDLGRYALFAPTNKLFVPLVIR